tara:strand:+ start:54 stop:575 length:522 start_codon:yes stop_codon:yes gene_type:complete
MASKETLNRLSDNKLIDAIKNHKQYGYSEELREQAIAILEERGISKEQLKLTGNLENTNYNYAKDLFDTYLKNSKIALVFYSILILTILIWPILTINSSVFNIIIITLNWISFIGFPIFLIKSFINQNEFSKLVNEDYATEGALMYIFIGIPLYILMYFYFRKDMREKMALIK